MRTLWRTYKNILVIIRHTYIMINLHFEVSSFPVDHVLCRMMELDHRRVHAHLMERVCVHRFRERQIAEILSGHRVDSVIVEAETFDLCFVVARQELVLPVQRPVLNDGFLALFDFV